MSTRICKRCGWAHPSDVVGTKCKICGEPFDEVTCHICGKIVSGKERVPGRNLCKVCHNEEERFHMIKYRAKRNVGFEQRFTDWKARIASVPKQYHTLTEEEWISACRYFNGCAQCGDENIEARGFFIQFKDGGRYCDWNVIPLCNKCAADWKLTANPFTAAWRRDNQSRAFNRRECLKKIVEYLGGKLDDACRTEEQSTEPTEQCK